MVSDGPVSNTRKPKKQKRNRALGLKDPVTEEGYPYSPYPAPLKAQNRLFLDFYMRHFNGSRAAIEAGYSRRSAGAIAHEILNRPEIRAEITRRRFALVRDLTKISQEDYQREIAKLAFASMADFAPMFGDDPIPDKLALMGRDGAAPVAEITVEEFRDGRSDYRHVRRTKFKLASKDRALELYGRARGWLVDKVDHKHEHQGLILHAMLEQIASSEDGRPIVEAEAIVDGKDGA